MFGYYLEVTNKYKNKGMVPENWVRKQTLTNAERYITEELKVLETKILTAQEKILVLEERLYNELIEVISGYIQPIQHNASIIAQLDCLLSSVPAAHLCLTAYTSLQYHFPGTQPHQQGIQILGC